MGVVIVLSVRFVRARFDGQSEGANEPPLQERRATRISLSGVWCRSVRGDGSPLLPSCRLRQRKKRLGLTRAAGTSTGYTSHLRRSCASWRTARVAPVASLFVGRQRALSSGPFARCVLPLQLCIGPIYLQPGAFIVALSHKSPGA